MYLSQIAKCICLTLHRHSIPPAPAFGLCSFAAPKTKGKHPQAVVWCHCFCPKKTFLALLVRIEQTAEKALLTHLEFKLCQFVGFSAKF